ncbi:MAG: hypothetical protein OXJ52_07855 [Oligoflexia bacterium]|nr:hypothetical protein [Oligoflexia bacterium]
MLETLNILLVFIGSILGWFFRKYWEQRLKKGLESYKSNLRIKENKDALLNEKKLNAIEQIKENINILSQGEFICREMQNLNFKKLKQWEAMEETKKIRMQRAFQETERLFNPIIQNIEKGFKGGTKEHEIEPYVSKDIWKFYLAYKTIIFNAISFIKLSSVSGLDFLDVKRMEQNIEKYISTVIPESEGFLKQDLLSRQFFVYDLVKEKLFKKLIVT